MHTATRQFRDRIINLIATDESITHIEVGEIIWRDLLVSMDSILRFDASTVPATYAGIPIEWNPTLPEEESVIRTAL